MTDIRAALEALVEELRPNCGKLRDQHGPLMGLGYAAALDDIADALAAASPEPERCAFSLGCGGKRDDPQHHRPYSGWGSLMAHDYEEPRTQPAPAAPTAEALRDALLADVRSLINSLLVAPSPEHVDEAVVALSVRLDAIIFAAARADERTRLADPKASHNLRPLGECSGCGVDRRHPGPCCPDCDCLLLSGRTHHEGDGCEDHP